MTRHGFHQGTAGPSLADPEALVSRQVKLETISFACVQSSQDK
jgi:hypothetical protein